ncbi:hypothetical protein DFH06DRAFT_1130102 [Mycena polygramma]|nr:hypothetical protein DFH06DRAFT_1130102 [Mycena polygramma]
MPRLRQILSSARGLLRHRPSTKLPFQGFLPMELWEIVFEQLERDSLLSAASTSIPSSSLTPIASPVDSGWRHASQLQHSDQAPVTWFPIVSDIEEKIQDLQHLRNIITRSPHVQQVALSFRRSIWFWDIGMRTHFCDILHAMAQKVPGPVVILEYGNICVIDRCYVAQWPRSKFQPPDYSTVLAQTKKGRGKTKKARTPVEAKSFSFRLPLLVRHNGDQAEVFNVRDLETVEIRTVHSRVREESFTLVNYEEHQQSFLNIGCSRRMFEDDIWASSEQLQAVLPYIHVPTLNSVRIAIAVDPIAFTRFLENHDGIIRIELERALAGFDGPHREILTEYPVVLPKLEHLGFHAMDDLIPLLNSFSWPGCCYIAIPFDPLNADAPAFRRVLRRLSQHTSQMKLYLHGPQLMSLWDSSMSLEDEDRLIASALDCVMSLVVDAGTVDEMRTLIPWISCLPRLRYLRGITRSVGSEYDKTLNEEVRAALPTVETTSPRRPNQVALNNWVVKPRMRSGEAVVRIRPKA